MTKKIFLKLCGVTNTPDAIACLCAGADIIGLIHVTDSPRYIDTHTAQSIASAVHERGGKTALVIKESDPTKIQELMQQTEATFAQLHAAYDEQTLIGTQNLRRILVIHADADNLDLLCEQVASHITPNQDSVLIERAGQGIETIQQIATYFSGFQTLLAGRIDAINIREFLSCPAILGFDVCQSIEQSPGKKSIKKIKTLSKALLGHLEEK